MPLRLIAAAPSASLAAHSCRVPGLFRAGNVVFESYSKPAGKITDYRTHVSGIKPADLKARSRRTPASGSARLSSYHSRGSSDLSARAIARCSSFALKICMAGRSASVQDGKADRQRGWDLTRHAVVGWRRHCQGRSDSNYLRLLPRSFLSALQEAPPFQDVQAKVAAIIANRTLVVRIHLLSISFPTCPPAHPVLSSASRHLFFPLRPPTSDPTHVQSTPALPLRSTRCVWQTRSLAHSCLPRAQSSAHTHAQGHAIQNDLKALLLSHPRRLIRDTSLYRPLMQSAPRPGAANPLIRRGRAFPSFPAFTYMNMIWVNI